MKTAMREKMPSGSPQLYALSPDYRPELKSGHVLTDQSLPVEERIEKAKADSIAKLNALIPKGKAGDMQSQIEVAKETPLLKWLCSEGVKRWVEERYPDWSNIFAKYQFKILNDGFVRFTLPERTSYVKLFKEANRYCKENGREWAAMAGWAMERFAKRADATRKSEHPETHEIQVLVPGSIGQTRAEQEQFLKDRGLSFATLEAGAAAAVLYYCATGRDLLDGRYVRTAAPGLGLYSNARGLIVIAYGGVGDRRADVGAAGARNLKT